MPPFKSATDIVLTIGGDTIPLEQALLKSKQLIREFQAYRETHRGAVGQSVHPYEARLAAMGVLPSGLVGKKGPKDPSMWMMKQGALIRKEYASIMRILGATGFNVTRATDAQVNRLLTKITTLKQQIQHTIGLLQETNVYGPRGGLTRAGREAMKRTGILLPKETLAGVDIQEQRLLARQLELETASDRRKAQAEINKGIREEKARRREEDRRLRQRQRDLLSMRGRYRSPQDILSYFGGSQADIMGRERAMQALGVITPEAALGYGAQPFKVGPGFLSTYAAQTKAAIAKQQEAVRMSYERIQAAGPEYVTRGAVLTGTAQYEKMITSLRALHKAMPEGFFKIDPETGKRSKALTEEGKRMFMHLSGGEEKLRGMAKQYMEMKGTLGEVNKRTGFWNQNLKAVLRWSMRIFGIYAIFRFVVGNITDLVKKSVEWNKELLRTRAITIGTGFNIRELSNNVKALSKQYGILAVDQLKAVKPLIQMRMSAKDIGIILPKALKFANVHSEDLNQTISALTSAIARFNLDAHEAADILEDWSLLESRYAISAKMLADGFEQMGGTAQDMGMNVQQLNALMAVLQERTRGGLPGLMRFMKMMAESFYTERGAVDIYRWTGVVSMTEEGMRNLFETIVELGKKWKTMTQIQKDGLVMSIKNTNAKEAFRTLMNATTEVQEAYNLQLEESNRLASQNNIIMDATERGLARLKSAWIDSIGDPMKESAGAFGNFLHDFLEGIDLINKKIEETNKKTKIPAKSIWESFTLPYRMMFDWKKQGQVVTNILRKIMPSAYEGVATKPIEPTAPGAEQRGMERARRADVIEEQTKKLKELEGVQKEYSDRLSRLGVLNLDFNKKLRNLNNETKTYNNKLSMQNELYRQQMGYSVGIKKSLIDEEAKRRKLRATIENANKALKGHQKLLDEYLSVWIKGAPAKPGEEASKEQQELFEKQLDIYKNAETNIIKLQEEISDYRLQIVKANTELMAMQTVLRDIAETFRTDIGEALGDILTKSNNWYEVNVRLRDLLSSLGRKVLDMSIDYLTSPLFAGIQAGGIAPFVSEYGGTNIPGGTGPSRRLRANLAGIVGAGAMGASIGQNRGTAGMWGGASGALLGAQLGSMVLPGVGTVIGSVLGGLAGSMFGKVKKDEPKIEDARQDLANIPSKLDITNNQLEIVNRNLVALRERFEPYPLRESFYFRQRPGTGLSVQSLNIYVPAGLNSEELIRYIENEVGLQSTMYYVGK